VPNAAPPRPPFTRTATLFESAACELIRGQDAACRLLQLLTTYGRKIRGSRFPRRDDGHDHLPFLTRHARPLPGFPEKSGVRAASRAFVRPIVTPVPVPPGYPGLPDRDASTVATPLYRVGLALSRQLDELRVQCRLTCTGLWTERRTCPRSWRRFLGVCRDECVRLAHADHVPLLLFQRTPVVAGATGCLGTSPTQPNRTDQDPRSSDSPRRLSASRGPGCLPPLRQRARERIAPLRFPLPASRSRRPHVAPMAGDKVLLGHCKTDGTSPPCVRSHFERAGRLCVTAL